MGRRRRRKNHRAGVHHHLHPETSAGAVRDQGTLRRELIMTTLTNSRTPFIVRLLAATPKKGWLAIAAFMAIFVLLLPALHLLTPADSPLHVSSYVITLGGKIMCYAIVAVAMDLIWGYAGILSLGHGVFFALGGYAFGMYLMRSIGLDGV